MLPPIPAGWKAQLGDEATKPYYRELDAFLDQVKPAAETARKALDAADETESRKLWRRLFGSTFGD